MTVAVALAPDEDQVDFELPEKRVPLNFRVPESVKLHLLSVVRLWKMTAIARGRDPDDVDLTYVVTQILKNGVTTIWTQVNQMAGLDRMPELDEEWAKLERALLKAAKEDQRTRGK